MSVLFGRDAELEAIKMAIAQAAAGTPTLLLLAGEAGGGKTALLRALEDSPLLPRRRIRVAFVDLAEDTRADPVLRAADLLTHHAKFARLGGRRRVSALVRRLLPEWMGVIPVWGDLLEAVTTTVETIRRKRSGKRTEVVAEEIEDLHRGARRRPAALLFDGAEHVDPAGADRLHVLIGGAETGTRLLIIAAYRPAAPGVPPPPIARASGRLDSQRRVTVALRPLASDAIRQWLERRLNGPVSQAVLDSFVEATGGLPSSIAQRLDRLLDAGAFTWKDGAWTEDPAIHMEADPVHVDLGPLGPDVHETLSASAVLGEEFESMRVARMLERDELWVEDRLAAAARLGLLHLVDDARQIGDDMTSVYRFASATTRASLRRSLDPARRAAWETRL